MQHRRIKAGKIMLVLAFGMALCFLTGTQGIHVSASTSLKSQTAKIVKKKTKTSDSKKVKLKKLFQYAEKQYGYKRTVGFQAQDGWASGYAAEMYKEKKGSCYHFAAAYAFLAKKATGYKVRIGVGKTNGFSGKLQNHAWTEIRIKSTWYICDTNMDKFAENSSGTYFLKKRNKLKKVYDRFKNVQYFTVAF